MLQFELKVPGSVRQLSCIEDETYRLKIISLTILMVASQQLFVCCPLVIKCRR